MNPDEMFLSKVRNAGYVDRRTYTKTDTSEDRLARIMARRAGVPTADLFLKRTLDAGFGAQPHVATDTDAFFPEEHEASQVGPESGFGSLISPLSTDDFFARQYRDRLPLIFRGTTGRFSSLVPWTDLNGLIRNHNLRHPQLKLVVDGERIPGTDYMRSHFGLGTKNFNIPENSRLDEHTLLRYLRNGATLIIDAVWTVHEPLKEFLSAIEAGIGVNANINLYASWRKTRGFATHWDSHDVFIVQVQGSKSWNLFGETRVHPMAVDVVPNVVPPENALWSGTLASGDVLYIPRGWWHDAFVPEALDGEGSIHLTVSLQEFTGHDVLTWLGSRLSASQHLFRATVPWLAGSDVVNEYFEEFRQTLVQSLDANIAQEFVCDMRSAWSEDVATHIDRTIDPWTAADWSAYTVVLRGLPQARLVVVGDGRSFLLVANGFTHELDMFCYDLVEAMVERGPICVAELMEVDPTRYPKTFVDQVLIRLVKENIILASPPTC